MTSDVADLLLRRQDQGSRPASRNDGRRVALAIEGGGMRGVVSAGMVSAFEYLGLRDSFDAVFGSSAGAINGAYFVAGQARFGTTIFYDEINNRQFINAFRLLSGRPVLSLKFLLDEVCVYRKPLAVDRVLSSDLPLFVMASSLIADKEVVLSNFSDQKELFNALRASARIPFFSGPPVSFRNDQLVDASLYESIPAASAEAAGYTDIVVLLTRPKGYLRPPPSWFDHFLVTPHLRRYSEAAAEAHMKRHLSYASELHQIEERTIKASGTRVLIVRASNDVPSVSPFNKERKVLVEAAKAGFKGVYAALGLPVPQVEELLTPI